MLTSNVTTSDYYLPQIYTEDNPNFDQCEILDNFSRDMITLVSLLAIPVFIKLIEKRQALSEFVFSAKTQNYASKAAALYIASLIPHTLSQIYQKANALSERQSFEALLVTTGLVAAGTFLWHVSSSLPRLSNWSVENRALALGMTAAAGRIAFEGMKALPSLLPDTSSSTELQPFQATGKASNFEVNDQLIITFLSVVISIGLSKVL
jgi:hypothetical protein